MSNRQHHIGFLWDQCCDYHLDRAEAVARALGPSGRVTLFEIASRSRVYDWPECPPSDLVERVTLFPGKQVEEVNEIQVALATLRALRKAGVTRLFLCGYEHPARFMVALLLRLMGRAAVVMNDSKFDDKPRRLRLELLKRLLLMPYRAGLASGSRSADYLRFLGLRNRPVATGYDAISIERMRALAVDIAPAWEDCPFLIVARLVEKKNIATALAAYAALGEPRRALRICGDGPLRGELEAQARDLGIADRVTMLGSVAQDVVAREMAGALCLVLPSIEEQWGIVINEAVALGLPVLASDHVGASDMLVGNYDNGFLLESRNVPAWTAAMLAISEDESLWQRFAEGARARARSADVATFVDAVLALSED